MERRCVVAASSNCHGVAEQETVRDDRAVNNAAVTKTHFAFNVDGSLLDLTMKLSKKEDEMLNRLHPEDPIRSIKCNFRSIIKGNGFHFCATKRKRKAEGEADAGEKVKWKKCCIQTEGNGIEDHLSSFEDEVTKLQVRDTKKDFFSSTEPLESNRRINKVETIRLMEKLLKNIRKFNNFDRSIDHKLKAQLPFELFRLWPLMSSTKYSANDEMTRVLDQKIVSCLSKSKVNYASWKMSQSDLRSVEQMAIDHVVRSKSNDLECRLVSKLRKMSQDVGVTVEESNVKTQRVKSLSANHLSQLTWNGGIQRKFRCEQCTYQTDNRSHLLRHQSSIHNMFKPYHCYICTKEFSRVEYIKQHLVTAHPGVQYDATRAKNELVFREQFQKQNQESKKPEEFSDIIHWDQNHKKEKVNGGMQEFQSPRADCTKLHTLNFFAEGNLLCSYCDFTTRDSREFLQHFEECRPNISTFCCRVCREAFLSRDYLQVHYANKHFLILYCCDRCPFYTTSLYTYDWHVAQLHFPRSDQNTCPICHCSFSKQEQLVLHIESVHLKQMNCGQNALASSSSSSGEMNMWNSAGGVQFNDCFQNVHGVMNGNQWRNGVSKNIY